MAIDRRRLLGLGAGALAGLVAPARFAQAAVKAEGGAVFVTAAAVGPDAYAALLVSEDGTILATIPLEARAHDVAIDPERRRVVVFARRPGRFAVVIDLAAHAPVSVIVPPAERHFFGHGVFSPDGRLLYATENDFSGGGARGVVAVYDASGGFARLGEFATHGVDAHEVILAPDGRTLVVANGGIVTHPDYGREKIDLEAMNSSLVRIDRETGDLVHQTRLDRSLQRLSIRHAVHDAEGALWFGCQWEGDPYEPPLLVGRLDPSGAATLLPMADEDLVGARNYIGGLAASRDGRLIAASAPRGGAILLFDAATGTYLRAAPLADGCGVAGATASAFLASSGGGALLRIDAAEDVDAGRAPVKFDNHMQRV
ncbi:DUF1513 domain-containing protein [Prosthecomicrobium pneumaticum]|uniref:DUF1513 domain-containing protein n=1 Tax=Prosthecomicrobium pneumaticum TaxID=81895 RepID=A0A7W9FLC7_9HYPH|nr:DUF1513 domain-containing protein [Prosthecomicrobium pneumaticum]MBB5752793.1 hypothetical protein [Prosthecomicrobium pneumaticum]